MSPINPYIEGGSKFECSPIVEILSTRGISTKTVIDQNYRIHVVKIGLDEKLVGSCGFSFLQNKVVEIGRPPYYLKVEEGFTENGYGVALMWRTIIEAQRCWGVSRHDTLNRITWTQGDNDEQRCIDFLTNRLYIPPNLFKISSEVSPYDPDCRSEPKTAIENSLVVRLSPKVFDMADEIDFQLNSF